MTYFLFFSVRVINVIFVNSIFIHNLTVYLINLNGCFQGFGVGVNLGGVGKNYFE